MFKKPFKTANVNVTKGSELKKIKIDICSKLTIDPDVFDSILSPKEKLIKVRLAGSHTIIYQETKENGRENGDPLFIDLEGRSEFFPTVYTLWRAPNLLRKFTIHAGVLNYIQSGADLMLPGVVQNGIENLNTLKKGEYSSIVVNHTSLPVGVGRNLVDSDDVSYNGMKGKGLESIHYIGDQIWAMGSQNMAPYEAEILSLQHRKTTEKSETTTTETSTTSQKEEVSTESPENSAVAGKLSQEELLQYCFMYAIKYHFMKDALPVLFNVFWGVMTSLPCRPLKSTMLDVKKTKWKKSSTFLLEKRRRSHHCTRKIHRCVSNK